MGEIAQFTPAEFPEPIQVLLSEDRLTAELLLMPLNGKDPPTVDLCCQHLQQSGVQVNDRIRKIVAIVLQALPRATRHLRSVVVQGRPAENGEDGRVNWIVGCAPQEDQNGRISHYERSAFTFVHRGQVLGEIIAATPGRDGRDVTGHVLEAQPGKKVELDLDETVLRDDEDRLIAQIDGIFHRDGEKVSIREMLEINEDVDFSTGNIEFNGDVIIRGGVGDRFVVKVGGDVEAHGVVGASLIACGGDLRALGGMAGNELGEVHVGGSVQARYFKSTNGRVDGDLCVERGVVGCELSIGGGIHAPRSTILGGRIEAAGPVEVGVLGSDGGVTTLLVVASGSPLDLKVRRYLYTGVRIQAGGRTYSITESLRGPLRVMVGDDGNLCFSRA